MLRERSAAGWDAVQYQSTTQLRNSLAGRGLLDDGGGERVVGLQDLLDPGTLQELAELL